MVAATLRSTTAEARALAHQLHRKSGGNPLFARHLLESLRDDGLIHFSVEAGRWAWDLDGVDLGVADDGVERLLDRLRRLPPPTQRLLTRAACIGSRFDLQTLAGICQTDLTELGDQLEPALCQQLIHPVSEAAHLWLSARARTAAEALSKTAALAFSHDRIQQAAAALLDQPDRAAIHLQIGRTLRAACSEAELDEQVFEIANHYAAALDLVDSARERHELVELLVRAGRRAKSTAAYATACTYLARALNLLERDGGAPAAGLLLQLRRERAECEYVAGDFERAEGLIDNLLQQLADPIERAQALGLRMAAYMSLGRYPEVLRTGAQVLAELGLPLPDIEQPVWHEVDREYCRFRALLGERQPEELIDLPVMQDPLQLVGLKLLQNMAASAYFTRDDLFQLICLRIMNLTLEHGNAPPSATGYTGLGPALLRAKDPRAYQLLHAFGRVGVQVAERFDDRQGAARAAFLFAFRVDPWQHHARAGIEQTRRSLRLCLEAGDLAYASFSSAIGTRTRLFCAVPLAEVVEDAEESLGFLHSIDAVPLICLQQLTMGFARALQGRTHTRGELSFDQVNEAQVSQLLDRTRFGYGMYVYRLYKLQLAFLFHRYEEAAHWHAEAAKLANKVADSPNIVEHHLYGGLVRAALYVDADTGAQREHLTAIEDARQRLETWAEAAPDNFRPMLLLLRAELARIRQQGDPEASYAAALAAARAGGFHQLEALSNERCALLHEARGVPKLARFHLAAAIEAYRCWGAEACARFLEQQYTALLAAGSHRASLRSSSSAGGSEHLDLMTVLRAGQAISEPIVLEQLLERVLTIVMRNAGARLGYLVLAEDGQLRVQAKGSVDPDQVAVLQALPMDAAGPLPAAVIGYVARTQETVVLDEAREDNRFAPADRATAARSVLCTPLLHRGRLAGILYLQHDLAGGVFTEDRVELLGLLSAQAATALENARLYANLADAKQELERYSETLERKVQNRTRALAQKNEQLQGALGKLREAQNQLVLSEKMASLGLLVAGIAHEINTPVGAMHSMTDTLGKAVAKLRSQLAAGEAGCTLGGRVENTLGAVEDARRVLASGTARVTEIVARLRAFARLDEAELKPADINAGLEDTLLLLNHELQPELTIVKDFGSLPPVACAPGRLNQVFMNLLNNARQAIDGPGRIVISTRIVDGELRVSVADTGCGIPEEQLARIFDPGFTTKGVGVGTGLGLSICYQIIKEHRGRIEVQSQPGAGTTVTVAIPADLDREADSRRQ
jgi:predicted ATPase/signal transduction histidine kinase